MSDDAPDTVRLPEPGPIIRLHPAELARRHALADRLIAAEEAREAAERDRWRQGGDLAVALHRWLALGELPAGAPRAEVTPAPPRR